MNDREKEVYQAQLDAEKAVLKKLEKLYQSALDDIDEKVKILQSDELTQSKIYQVEYQKALRGQIAGIVEKLHGDEYTTIQQYLHDCYTDAFVGTMYDIHGQGIPLILPIDQNAAVKAIQLDSKINEGLYKALGVDATALKKTIQTEVSRGIATSLGYSAIARNISNASKAPRARAMLIARTESHRITQASTFDAQQGAKKRGCDVLKQWDATMDGDTRSTHRQLDGQLREIDKPFELGNKKAMFPGDFGDPAEDCNCRCVSNTRAKWDLDEDEMETLKERAEFFGLDKSAELEEFKKTYLDASMKVKPDEMDYMSASFRPKFGQENVKTSVSIADGLTTKTVTMQLKKVTNSSFDMLVDTDATRRSKAVRLTESNLSEVAKTLPDGFTMPTVAVVDFEKNGLNTAAIAGYDREANTLFVNSKYDTKKKVLEFLAENPRWFADKTEYAPYNHELGHKYYDEIIKNLAKREKMDYNGAKDRVDAIIADYVKTNNDSRRYIVTELGGYADQGYGEHQYGEIVAECFAVRGKSDYADELLKLLGGD